jgi:hypothetical protein
MGMVRVCVIVCWLQDVQASSSAAISVGDSPPGLAAAQQQAAAAAGGADASSDGAQVPPSDQAVLNSCSITLSIDEASGQVSAGPREMGVIAHNIQDATNPSSQMTMQLLVDASSYSGVARTVANEHACCGGECRGSRCRQCHSAACGCCPGSTAGAGRGANTSGCSRWA